MTDTPPVLTCNKLTRTFSEGLTPLTVLHNAELTVHAGERVAVVGSSGSGKTTLLQLLAGLDRPSAGAIYICGESIADLNEQQRNWLRNRKLGFVYQFHHLLPEFTALENVSMPLLIDSSLPTDGVTTRATAMLESVGLAQRSHHKPAELSGGERQRVAIARALVNEPALVFMDEPTGNLDPATAEKVQALIHSLSQTRSTAFLVVTHDPGLARQMDRVLRLDGGRLRPEL